MNTESVKVGDTLHLDCEMAGGRIAGKVKVVEVSPQGATVSLLKSVKDWQAGCKIGVSFDELHELKERKA